MSYLFFFFLLRHGVWRHCCMCHISCCPRHSLPIHCAVTPNALLLYASARLSTAQKGRRALSRVLLRDQAHELQCRQPRVSVYPGAAAKCCVPTGWPCCLFFVSVPTFIRKRPGMLVMYSKHTVHVHHDIHLNSWKHTETWKRWVEGYRSHSSADF